MKKLLILLLSIFTLIPAVGCMNNSLLESSQNEYGFVDSCFSDPDITYRCAYKLPQTEFNKSNATIEFFYGHFSVDDEGTDMIIRVFLVADEPSRPINEWDTNAYFIKEISGKDFMSDEYSCYGKINEEGKTVWEFSHSETIKIPERFFDREEGSIMLGFVEYSVDSQTYGSVKSINVNFRVAGDSVTFYVPNNK